MGKAKGDYVNPADAREDIASIATRWLSAREQVMKPIQLPSAPRAVGDARAAQMGWSRSTPRCRTGWPSSRVSALPRRCCAHGVLAAVLDVAERDRRVSRNVARGVALPRKVPKSKPYLTHEQVGSLAAASTYPVSLRWGEATGLRVKHVDALRRRVSVEKNAILLGGVVHVDTPKTHEARSVPYPAFLSLSIAKLCEGKRREDLLFGDGVAPMRLPNSVRVWFAFAVKRVRDVDEDFPRVTAHDMRHTAASLAISAGANVKAVQRMLGHACSTMTWTALRTLSITLAARQLLLNIATGVGPRIAKAPTSLCLPGKSGPSFWR